MIGAMVLAIGVSAAFIGQTEVILAGHVDQEHFARNVAAACAEEALHRLKLNSGYVGGTVPVGSQSCTATVTGSGSTRTVSAAASSAEFVKTIVIGASLRQNAALNASAWHIDSWTEADP